jgi:hypothetical protein
MQKRPSRQHHLPAPDQQQQPRNMHMRTAMLHQHSQQGATTVETWHLKVRQALQCSPSARL